jgi:serine/threonine-protein phosphatase 4 regulatory subunit 1
MADIYFYQDEDTNDTDGTYSDSEAITNPDDLLPPIEKLQKYAESDNIFNRQFIARTVLDTLRLVTDLPDDVEAVLKVMNKLADDLEPSVRAELMEQVPHIAMYCQEFKSKLSHVVPESLLPMVVKFLTDFDIQVRKTSQAALLVLLEQGLVEKNDVKEQVCPVIIRLTEADSLDDYRTEAVALLSKMAPLIGKEMSEAIFLERFAALCVDPLFHVRKVCAANFGDFSSVVGMESTEKVLVRNDDLLDVFFP